MNISRCTVSAVTDQYLLVSLYGLYLFDAHTVKQIQSLHTVKQIQSLHTVKQIQHVWSVILG